MPVVENAHDVSPKAPTVYVNSADGVGITRIDIHQDGKRRVEITMDHRGKGRYRLTKPRGFEDEYGETPEYDLCEQSDFKRADPPEETEPTSA